MQCVKYTKYNNIAKEIAKCCAKYGVLDKKVKTQYQQNKRIKHINPCQSRELNTGPLAPNANTFSLHHLVYTQLRTRGVLLLFSDALGRFAHSASGHTGCKFLLVAHSARY